VTRLIHTTFETIAKRADLAGILADSHRARSAFAEASGGRLLRARDLRTTPIRNPYFAVYDEVADLCRKILAEETADPGLEDDAQFSGFLFDVSLLFEHYVRRLLIDAGLEVSPKLTRSSPDAIGYPTGRGRRRLLPDIILQSARGTLILDVKYKRWNMGEGVSREDAFQLITYAAAYRNHFRRGVFGYGIIFPGEGAAKELIQDEFPELGLRFHVLFLNVPPKAVVDGQEDESVFRDSIRRSEDAFIASVRKVLSTP
jgi:5-methylcytosine-specific restriction endonuclease McrBC regulatory subunit McrC